MKYFICLLVMLMAFACCPKAHAGFGGSRSGGFSSSRSFSSSSSYRSSGFGGYRSTASAPVYRSAGVRAAAPIIRSSTPSSSSTVTHVYNNSDSGLGFWHGMMIGNMLNRPVVAAQPAYVDGQQVVVTNSSHPVLMFFGIIFLLIVAFAVVVSFAG